MLKRRIATALAATLVAAHYAIAAADDYGRADSRQLSGPQTTVQAAPIVEYETTGQPAATASRWNDAAYPRDAIYGQNRSDPGVRATWGELRGFPPSDDLVGQRPLPAQERYFAQHEQQLGARSCGIAALPQEQPAYC